MMAQRLVRKLCPECKKEKKPTDEEKRMIDSVVTSLNPEDKARLNVKSPYKIYEPGPGCGSCIKGTRGRIGIFEVLQMTLELEKIILKEPNEGKIAEEARRQKVWTMLKDGIIKVLQGTVSFEEVVTVIGIE